VPVVMVVQVGWGCRVTPRRWRVIEVRPAVSAVQAVLVVTVETVVGSWVWAEPAGWGVAGAPVVRVGLGQRAWLELMSTPPAALAGSVVMVPLEGSVV